MEIELGDGQLCETHKAKWMWEIDKTNRVAASRARRNAATLANCQARDFVGAAVKADVRWSRLISEITALLMTAITVSLAIFFVFTPNLVSITVAGFWKRKKNFARCSTDMFDIKLHTSRGRFSDRARIVLMF